MLDIDEINKIIHSPKSNVDSLKGFEIISEALVYKIINIFGKNSLLTILYQVGAGPAETISNRLKEKYVGQKFTIIDAFALLVKELNGFYSIKIREIKEDDKIMRIIIENHCFLRQPINNRPKLEHGKTLCRINKGYFEVGLKKLLEDQVSRIELNFVEDDKENDVCIEEIVFTKK